jgi:hypothetical protein
VRAGGLARYHRDMSRPKRPAKSSKSAADRARALPWALLVQAGFVVGRRVGSLSASERRRLTALLRDSGGRLGTLTEKERKELRKLAAKLDLRGMGGDLLPLLRGGRGRRRGRRG